VRFIGRKEDDKKAEVVDRGRLVSVVYYNIETGVIDWTTNAGDGVLLVPRPMSESGWVARYSKQTKRPVQSV
jgi:hypothetical protein